MPKYLAKCKTCYRTSREFKTYAESQKWINRHSKVYGHKKKIKRKGDYYTRATNAVQSYLGP